MDVRRALLRGVAIPAHPLALTARLRIDERRQRALTRYYVDAGAGGLAVGVHTTQFAIHRPGSGLLRPVLELAIDAMRDWRPRGSRPVMIAGVVGSTTQAVTEARLACDLGYDAALVSLAGWPRASDDALLRHVRAVADVSPVMGFYLQPAVGGRILSYRFWRRLVDIDNVVAIKVAPFDRYRTIDVIRAVIASGRAREVAIYTGNDDHIVLDLLSTWRGGDNHPLRVVGGLLGQWAVWTQRAVALHRECAALARAAAPVPARLLTLAAQLTDANGAIFDAAHGFRGCIAGIQEVLRRDGLLRGRWCLEPMDRLSPGQLAEIDRVWLAYPHLRDDAFVAENRDRWLR